LKVLEEPKRKRKWVEENEKDLTKHIRSTHKFTLKEVRIVLRGGMFHCIVLKK